MGSIFQINYVLLIHQNKINIEKIKSINFRPKYQIVSGFEQDFSRYIPEVWSIPYRFGTLVIWIKRQYWSDSRLTNDEQHFNIYKL